MKQLEDIRILKGATCLLKIDLRKFNFNGGSVVLNIEDELTNEIVFTKTLTTQSEHIVQINDEVTATFEVTEGAVTNKNRYKYDLMHIVGDERYALCYKSNVKVFDTVGGYKNG